MKVSTIIITRNEEENIQECLKTLNFSDEIIIIDNISEDKTVERARSLGATVYKVSGLDFSYLRNIGKEKAKGEWLFYIDCDERVTKELASEIKSILNKNTKYCAFYIRRQNYFFGHPWPKIERMIRLIKKESLVGWQGALHETPIVIGRVGILNSFMLHFTHRDLYSMLNKTNEWSEIEAQLRYRSNHPSMSWWRFFRVMITTFWRYYIIEAGWKVGAIGLIESIYQSFSVFITYAKLWERQNKVINPKDNISEKGNL